MQDDGWYATLSYTSHDSSFMLVDRECVAKTFMVLFNDGIFLTKASMGATEGKSVGEWFGPNTIAHVLK